MSQHESWLIANMVVSALSVVVLTALLLVYARNFRSIRSTFSVGLVLFAVLFLIQSVAAIALYWSMALPTGPDLPLTVVLPMLALNLVELAGFAVLFWISWE